MSSKDDYSNNHSGNDSEEETIKSPLHPLENTWSWWFYHNNRENAWKDNLHEVHTFGTVEDFWSIYNQMMPASSLSHGNDYMLFKKGISPMWEDRKNNQGGRWLVNLDNFPKAKLDEMWLDLVLYMIGENFDDYTDEICGAFLNIRPRGDKLSLWTGNANNKDAIMAIGKKLKELFNFREDMKISYESHAESERKKGAKVKNAIIL